MDQLKKAAPILAAMCAVAMGCFVALAGGYNIDNWYMISTGHEILANGIPHENPFAAETGPIDIIVQQWLYCVIIALLYDTGGWAAIGAFHAVLVAASLAAAVYAAAPACRNHPERAYIAVIPAMICYLPIWQWRPHPVTFALMLLVIGALERYRRDKDGSVLAIPVLIACFHANMHSSMALLDLGIIVAYLIPDMKLVKWNKPNWDYNRLVVLVAAVGAMGMMFLNPYGPDGAFYTLLSLGDASYMNAIGEMAPVTEIASNPFIAGGVVYVLSVGAVLVASSVKKKEIDVPVTILWFASLAFLLVAVRNMSLVAVASVPALASAIGDAEPGKQLRAYIAVPLAALVAGTAYIAAYTAANYGEGDAEGSAAVTSTSTIGGERESKETPVGCLDVIEEHGAKPGDKVMTMFYNGGYISHREYLVTADCRPELWSDNAITKTGNVSWHTDYADAVYGEDRDAGVRTAEEKLLPAAGSCKWAVVWNGDARITEALENSEDWVRIGASEYSTAWENIACN